MDIAESDEREDILFCGIPKNATRSILEGLNRFFFQGNLKVDHNDPKKIGYKGSQYAHMPLKWWLSNVNITKDCFIFGVVRNSWDRGISHIFYLDKCFRKEGKRSPFTVDVTDLDVWERNIEILCGFKSKLWKHDMSLDQCDYLEVPISKRIKIFNFDNLDSISGYLSDEIGEFTLKRENVGPSKIHYSNYYTDLARKTIEERYKRDIFRYGFTFVDKRQH